MRDTPDWILFVTNGSIHVISGWGKEANWYKNILAYPDDVYVQAGFRRFHARAELVEDREELQQMMKWLVKAPRSSGPEGKAMGAGTQRDDPETAGIFWHVREDWRLFDLANKTVGDWRKIMATDFSEMAEFSKPLVCAMYRLWSLRAAMSARCNELR